MIAFVVIDDLIAIIFYFPFNMFGNGADLGLVIGFADDKEICYRLMDLAEIQGNDVLALFFLDRVDNGFDDLRVLGKPCHTLLAGC